MSPESLVTKRLPVLIGRRDERDSVARAITGQGPSILYLEGVAGIGKTFLLEEAGRIAQEHGALCPPIVDFYDTEMHAHPALEAAIALSLDQEKKAFQGYWTRREQIERTLSLERKTLQEQQEELWELFLQGYTSVAEKQRVVLRFDTAERLEYERDSEEVLADCEVSPQDAPSWEWLLERVSKLKNTNVFIAARPTTGLLKQRLLEAHRERVLSLEVKGFTLEETETYFRVTDFGKQVADEAPEMVGKIHLLTEGRPILIALALDWLQRGMWERRIYPASLAELGALKGQAQEEESTGQRGAAWWRWDEVKRGFEMALVQQIRSLDHTGLDTAVKYAALARKGCNAELLSRLMGVPLEEAEELVAQLLTLSFVKLPRTPRQLFFLHDEMYDLVEKYIWLVDWPDYSEQARLDETIISWYADQIEKLKHQIEASQDRQERRKLRSQQQLLMAECLYYQFDMDPRIGYREYSYLDEEAIGAREHEWDAWLRNEALWFTSHRAWRRGKPISIVGGEYPLRDPAWVKNGKVERSPAVDHDCRRRWVNRYIARNEMEKAVRVAEKLLQKPFVPEEPELWRGGVRIALATAQAYMGGESLEPALRNFQEGIKQLEGVPEEHKEPWLYPYLMATAHLYRGLALRNTLRLSEAAQAYSQAARHYRNIGYQSGLAEALNNLAYIYARQGRLEPARASCEEALRIRRELGDEYYIALSLNTKGIINERMDRPLTGIRNSEEALALFKDIGDERGIILAEINLGRLYRRLARSPEWGHKDEDFRKGEGYLADAIYRQEQMGASADMFYRIEAHNELGCLYRDWVAMLVETIGEDLRSQNYLDEAERQLLEAVDLATAGGQVPIRHAVQYVDCLEDLARVYYWRGKLESPVGSWAEQRGIDGPFQAMKRLLSEAEGFATEHLREWEELGLIVGKIYHQYARLYREKEKNPEWNPEEAARYYARAAWQLEGYSPDLPELRKTVSDACAWLGSLEPEEAERQVRHMHAALVKEGRVSHRLQEWINSVVYPSVGVCWPGGENNG